MSREDDVKVNRIIPFDQWTLRYDYFISCMIKHINMHFMEAALDPSVGVDWPGLRRDLAVFLYKSSYNRFEAFKLIK